MSILVDPEEVFPVRLKYEELFSPEGAKVGVRILPPSAEGENVRELVCDAVGRDMDHFSPIMDAATVINHISGKPMVRTAILCKSIVLTFFRGWNLKEGDEYVPINAETVGRAHFNIVKALGRRWMLMTGGAVKAE